MDLYRVLKRYVEFAKSQESTVQELMYLERENCTKGKYDPRCVFVVLYIILISSIFPHYTNKEETEDNV